MVQVLQLLLPVWKLTRHAAPRANKAFNTFPIQHLRWKGLSQRDPLAECAVFIHAIDGDQSFVRDREGK